MDRLEAWKESFVCKSLEPASLYLLPTGKPQAKAKLKDDSETTRHTLTQLVQVLRRGLVYNSIAMPHLSEQLYAVLPRFAGSADCIGCCEPSRFILVLSHLLYFCVLQVAGGSRYTGRHEYLICITPPECCRPGG